MKCFAMLVVLLAAAPVLAKDAPLYKTRNCDNLTAQMDMTQCAGDNEAAADARLNAVYKQVMASKSDPADKDGLKQAERSWIKYRDKHCKDENESDEGGSIWPMEMSICNQAETDKRIRVLQRMLTCTAGASVCNPH
ncbi:MAG TPA: lysozyme inhibitor LprI family protein [Rhizomicrobium sp.]|jgi:uncharacterized protein YecT (DUF1311 family)